MAGAFRQWLTDLAAPGSGDNSNVSPGVPPPPPTPPRGGKREGAGRPKRKPAPEPNYDTALDVARHVDPNVEPAQWDRDLEDRFIDAYFQRRTNMLGASRVVGVTFRQALAHREESADFAERLNFAALAYHDVLLEEQQRRAMEDPNRPASLIFELKSRHPEYKPASGNNTVKINVAFVDKAFGATPAIEAVPERRLLVEPVIDVEPGA